MKTLVVAPHPDDEILGCGGLLLRRKAAGAKLGWLLVTGMEEEAGYMPEQVRRRDAEIAQVVALVGFDDVFDLRFPPARLSESSIPDLIDRFSEAFNSFQPDEVLVPHRSDAHTDHRLVFDAAAACTKWFRHPFVRRVLAYETISETDVSLGAECAFNPNYFVDIGEFLERKLELVAVYQSELGEFPFPRSVEAIRAMAMLRGATSGFKAAEAFQLLRERL